MSHHTTFCLLFTCCILNSDLIKLQALPDDLKTKLSIDDDLVSSPKEALSRASADRRMKYLNRYLLIFITYLSCLKKNIDMYSTYFSYLVQEFLNLIKNL